MMTIRVVLADDHPVVRAGVRKLLEGISFVRVIAEAEDGREAIERVREHRPDIIFMDISMPALRGLEAAALISKEFPDVRVIILTVHKGQEYVERALREAGAAGYLLKDADPDEYKRAIQAVMQGGSYLGPEVTKQIIESYVDSSERTLNPLDQLSSRQREVLQLIAEGKKNKEIADILHLSVKTVETHRGQLMAVLDIHDVPGLVRFAIQTGLVSLE